MINRNRRQSGFSLIELLIVVAIILIIAAIAIPNLLSARKTSANSQAAGNARTFNTAIKVFQGQCTQALPATPGDMTNPAPTGVTVFPSGSCTAAAVAGSGALGPSWAPAKTGSGTVGSFTYTYQTDGLVPDGGWQLTVICANTNACSDAYYIDGNGTFTHAGDGVGATAPSATSPPVGS